MTSLRTTTCDALIVPSEVKLVQVNGKRYRLLIDNCTETDYSINCHDVLNIDPLLQIRYCCIVKLKHEDLRLLL